jgi:hypothetical protein
VARNWETDPNRLAVKNQIKDLFDKNVRGRTPTIEGSKTKHDGHEGHWLQEQFGLKADAKNAPDFKGFELKDSTRSKTTFGDWPADEYLFFSHIKCINSEVKAKDCRKCKDSKMSRDTFLETFGTPTESKGGRFSWSGTVFPKVGKTNQFGQIMIVSDNGDVLALYSFEADQRPNKGQIIPEELKSNDVQLAKWNASSLQLRLERKFKKLGWFKCLQGKDGHGPYVGIQFGGPIEFPYWIEQVRKGTVFLDSGMYQGNKRPYASWRAMNSIWDGLVEETY